MQALIHTIGGNFFLKKSMSEQACQIKFFEKVSTFYIRTALWNKERAIFALWEHFCLEEGTHSFKTVVS